MSIFMPGLKLSPDLNLFFQVLDLKTLCPQFWLLLPESGTGTWLQYCLVPQHSVQNDLIKSSQKWIMHLNCVWCSKESSTINITACFNLFWGWEVSGLYLLLNFHGKWGRCSWRIMSEPVVEKQWNNKLQIASLPPKHFQSKCKAPFYAK